MYSLKMTGSSRTYIPRLSAFVTQSRCVLNAISDWVNATSISSVIHYLLFHHLTLCSLEFFTVSLKNHKLCEFVKIGVDTMG